MGHKSDDCVFRHKGECQGLGSLFELMLGLGLGLDQEFDELDVWVF